jgi:hypothetical protein
MRTHKSFSWPRRGLALAALAVALPLGCSDILEIKDPDIVPVPDANSPAAALSIANGVVLRVAQAVTGTQGPDALFLFGGLVTDEWRSGDTFVQRNNQDQRIFDPTNTFNAGPFRALNRVRVQAEQAIKGLRQFHPDSTPLVGEMYALTAFSEVLIGEHYCNGTPLSRVEGSTVIPGVPLTNQEVLSIARANADSAIAEADVAIARADSALANPTPSDTAAFRRLRDRARTVRQLASVVQGRALGSMHRDSLPAAAAAVAGVPDTFRFAIGHSVNSSTNQIWALNNSAKRYTMVDREGGTGINYISANDPRLPRLTGTRSAVDRVFDSAFPLFVTRQGLYGQESSIPIVTGVEARLIEAEAALTAAPATWLATINALRTNPALYTPMDAPATPTPATFSRGPALVDLADPGTDSLRIATHFRERAFWFFSLGHRLGDMRRLARPVNAGGYGWSASGVYPVGTFFKGGSYGSAVNLAVPFQETNNPNFTQCLDVNP